MPDIDQLYSAFVQAWRAGEAPDPDGYLDRAAPGDQDELAERIETFVMLAPSVEPTAERAAEIRASPVFVAAAAIASPGAPPWSARLRAARERAGLSLADLGSRFAEAFGHQGQEQKATTLLGDLESGALPPTGVTRRAGERLADLLGLAAGALTPPPRAQVRPLFRADHPAPAAGRPDPGVTSEPSPEDVAALTEALDLDYADWDGLDELLRGGDD